MGTVISQGTLIPAPELTEEVQQSFEQIIQAINYDITFESRHHHHHHHHHHNSPISHSTSTEKEEPIRHSHRSRSLDEYHPEEHQQTIIRRQWQCRLCHTKNESDTLICVDCGSNKINVYIPIIDHMKSSQRQHNPSVSALVK
jgi:hypothetical protein